MQLKGMKILFRRDLKEKRAVLRPSLLKDIRLSQQKELKRKLMRSGRQKKKQRAFNKKHLREIKL